MIREGGPGRQQHSSHSAMGFRTWSVNLHCSTLVNFARTNPPAAAGCVTASLSPPAHLQLVKFKGFNIPIFLVPASISGPSATSRPQPQAQGFPLVTVLGSDSRFSRTLYMVSCRALRVQALTEMSNSGGKWKRLGL